MTNSEAIAILNIFDYRNENKPNYYGIPDVKYIYHNEWSDPELYYKGEYYNINYVEDPMHSDYIDYTWENPEHDISFKEYLQSHTDDILYLLEQLRLNRDNY